MSFNLIIIRTPFTLFTRIIAFELVKLTTNKPKIIARYFMDKWRLSRILIADSLLLPHISTKHLIEMDETCM
ncbi:hypothetical protein [Maribacter ulvicola]|uniref:hypothetical protein n=1 Tax=Maribacter ulvicola TaxID=228959 RepID=UPI00117D71E4|nr:hypothetical protein [Maribacter ulvicola]